MIQHRFVKGRPPGSGECARSPWPRGFGGSAARISEIAARNGLSREGFSRKFAGEYGMPPHAYRIVDRLNAARRRLWQDACLAALAAELDFADQSHFGRHFRRAFGVTPRAYREGMR
ncbi:helix-turn-helix domain-containing protein [Methylocella sp.]|uniref:helix-turn-helix domain-containing protein n=1 Tax=Methylocella sp. TaxID=1978226 RepID=UPI003C712F33